MEEPGIRHKTCFSSSLLLDNECMWWLYSTQSQSPNNYYYCIAPQAEITFFRAKFLHQISRFQLLMRCQERVTVWWSWLTLSEGWVGWAPSSHDNCTLCSLHGTTTDNTQYPALPSRTATLLPKKSPRRDCGESKAPRCVGLFVSFRPPSVSVT